MPMTADDRVTIMARAHMVAQMLLTGRAHQPEEGEALLYKGRRIAIYRGDGKFQALPDLEA